VAVCVRSHWRRCAFTVSLDACARRPFPLDADYADGLKSDVADTLQCTVSSEADHILAAAFLRKFVREDVPWLHIDLAGPAAAGGLAHVSGDARGDFTGFGVRAAVWAVCDQWEDLAGEA
jgi:leucyl aminopeptidase